MRVFIDYINSFIGDKSLFLGWEGDFGKIKLPPSFHANTCFWFPLGLRTTQTCLKLL